MTRNQRYKYDTLVRVRGFGEANTALFPDSSTGGEKFAQIAKAVAEIDEHLKNRILGRVDGRGVKLQTRAAVFNYMKTLALAGRRVMREERDVNPFRMPPRRTLQVELSTARAFIEEAEQRQEKFVAIGLPSTFISDFTALVNDFQEAIEVRLNSKNVRGRAQEGIAAALAYGLEVIRDLDVVVAVAARHDRVLAAAWHAARHIEGQGASHGAAKVPEVDAAKPPAAETPGPAKPPAAEPPMAQPTAPDPVPDEPLEKAS